MKKILILNFKRYGDIFQTAVLAQSLKKEKGNCEVSLLCYHEFSHAFKNILTFDHIVTVNRKEIVASKKLAFCPQSLKMKILLNNLEQIISQKWDEVINFSSDKVSSYIIQLLKEKDEKIKISGSFYQTAGVLDHSSFSAFSLASILPQIRKNSIPLINIHGMISGTDITTFDTKDIITSINTDNNAKEKFKTLREQKENITNSNKIIGIHFKTSTPEKDIPMHLLERIIEHISSSTNMIPLLMTSQDQVEKDIAKEINRKRNQKIAVAESDFHGTSSILKHIDLLITADTSIKHLAALVGTKSIEISYDIEKSLFHPASQSLCYVIDALEQSADFLMEDIEQILNISCQKEFPKRAFHSSIYQTHLCQVGVFSIPMNHNRDHFVDTLVLNYAHKEMDRQKNNYQSYNDLLKKMGIEGQEANLLFSEKLNDIKVFIENINQFEKAYHQKNHQEIFKTIQNAEKEEKSLLFNFLNKFLLHILDNPTHPNNQTDSMIEDLVAIKIFVKKCLQFYTNIAKEFDKKSKEYTQEIAN